MKAIIIKKTEIKKNISSVGDILVFLSPDCTVVGDISALNILARGNFNVKGNINVDNSMEVLGNLKVDGVLRVPESIEVGGDCDVKLLSGKCLYLKVGGKIIGKNIETGIPSGLARYQFDRNKLPTPKGFPKDFFNSTIAPHQRDKTNL